MSTEGNASLTEETARLLHELEEAELYEQKLRGLIVAVRDALAAGQTARALSMCNQALNEIDNATDVIVPASNPEGPSR